MVTPPRTAPLPAKEIIGYYSQLCDAVKIPVMLQDADFTGAGMPAKVFVELSHKHPNFRFAKLEVTLPGEKCAEIVEQTKGQVQIIYGLGGIAMMDGLAHGASAMMPGAACLEVYVRVYELYQEGRHGKPRNSSSVSSPIWPLHCSTLRLRFVSKSECCTNEEFCRIPVCARRLSRSAQSTRRNWNPLLIRS